MEIPEGESFTILARRADGRMEGIYSRIRLILIKGDLKKWLFFKEEDVKLLNGQFERLQRKRSEGQYRQLSLF